jgi:hypothetical protein
MPPQVVTGKYILIAHGKQLTSEKYDIPFNFESLSFFVPSGYVLENPTYTTGKVNISKQGEIARLLCNNNFNADRISKVPVNGTIRLRQMTFSVSKKDKNPGNEDFLMNAGLYYCDTNGMEIILDWNGLNENGKMGIMDILNRINIHSESRNINPRTTAVFFYTCRSSCVEGRKGSFAPIIFPFRGPEKVIGQSGPSMRQKQGVFEKLSQMTTENALPRDVNNSNESRTARGGLNSEDFNSPITRVDENTFYRYIAGGSITKITKNKTKNKNTNRNIRRNIRKNNNRNKTKNSNRNKKSNKKLDLSIKNKFKLKDK